MAEWLRGWKSMVDTGVNEECRKVRFKDVFSNTSENDVGDNQVASFVRWILIPTAIGYIAFYMSQSVF